MEMEIKISYLRLVINYTKFNIISYSTLFNTLVVGNIKREIVNYIISNKLIDKIQYIRQDSNYILEILYLIR